jgi:hypothetical protein
MLFDVHIFGTVRAKVSGIEAGQYAEAAQKAENAVDLHKVFGKPPGVASTLGCDAIEFADEVAGFTVDVVGDENYLHTQHLDADGTVAIVELEKQTNLKAIQLLRDLVRTVQATGGLVRSYSNGELYCEADHDWLDLADVAHSASQLLQTLPVAFHEPLTIKDGGPWT